MKIGGLLIAATTSLEYYFIRLFKEILIPNNGQAVAPETSHA